MSTAYNPREGSVAWKVIEFLTTNPDETLSTDDVASKYDVGRNNVHSLLGQAVSTGLIVRKEDLKSDDLVYTKGSGHAAIKANASRNPTLRGAAGPWSAAAAKPPTRRARLVLDADALPLDDGIPLPAKQAGRRLTDWPALFARMKAGQSVLLPKQSKATLGKAITVHHNQEHEAELTIRVVDEEHIRLWRVK